MKNSIKYISLCFVLLLVISCGDDELDISYELGKSEYTLPKGEPGSVEERIYNIYEKYGTYILYEFDSVSMGTLWTSSWTRWYKPANLSNNKKYVSDMLDMVERAIFNKYDASFIRRTFPYKIFLVDSLSKSYYVPEKASDYVNMSSNGQHAFAISNVGKKSESYTVANWTALEVELNALFTQNYFAALPIKPVQFVASKHPTLTFQILPTDSEDEGYERSCWTAGFILGRNNTTYLSPQDSQDYADFVGFLTGTPAKELDRRLKKYEKLKTRAMLLVPYLDNVVNLGVIATQNKNCPEDKLSADYFDKLQ